MLFSILIPVYNVEKFLRECLNSICTQTFKDFEVIIVNNGSTDNSLKICKEFQKKMPIKFTIINQENKGLVLSRRTAIKKAKGQYLVFVDSDDFVETTMLEQLKEIIEKSSPDIIMYNAVRYCEGHISKHKPLLYNEDIILTGNEKNEIIEKLLSRELSTTLWSKAIKRDIVDINQDYSQYKEFSICEDLIQLLPILDSALSIYYTTKIFYYYRINPNSTLHQKYNPICYLALKTANCELNKYLEKWNLSKYNKISSNRFMTDVSDLFIMISSNCSLNEKIIYFKEISNDYYFRERFKESNLINIKKYQKFIVTLFYRNLIKTLVVLSYIYKIRKNIINSRKRKR